MTTPMRRAHALVRRAHALRPCVVGLALAGFLGCSNAGGDLGFDPLGTGTVSALVYLDRDGSLTPTGGADTAFAGIRVGLVVSGTSDTVLAAQTDAQGNVVFTDVPFGNYQFVVDSNTVGDSIQIQAIDSGAVRLRANITQWIVTARLGYPALTIAQARTAAAGTRVFVKGIMLAGPGVFGDTTAHISENGVAIRLTRATNAGFATQPGDSVRVLGTVATRAGQPVLDNAVINAYRIAFVSPTGTPLSTLLASNADTAAQDAALVVITGAVVQDTSTVGTDFHVGVDDGSGRLVLVLDGDAFAPIPRAQFDVGKIVTGTGVLVPTGTGSWIFKPRIPMDLTVT